jgi:dihydroorotase
LKRGDILTHPFNPPPATPPARRQDSNLIGGRGDKVLPQILELKDRGIWTDGQAALSHHAWEVSEKAASQGWFPDSISTDLGRTPAPGGLATRALPVIMSQYLHLGLSVDQVVERVTANPGKMLKYPERIGTLEVGSTADVSILDLVDGKFEFADLRGQTRTGRQMFVPVATVKSGRLVKAAKP